MSSSLGRGEPHQSSEGSANIWWHYLVLLISAYLLLLSEIEQNIQIDVNKQKRLLDRIEGLRFDYNSIIGNPETRSSLVSASSQFAWRRRINLLSPQRATTKDIN